jgi:hypothetical protein
MWLPLLSFSAALLTGLPVEENQSQPSQALLPPYINSNICAGTLHLPEKIRFVVFYADGSLKVT